jgi:SOS-response transcriptional repressor LexA
MMNVHNLKPYQVNHERRARIVAFIESYFVSNCRPPSMREICSATQIASTSHVRHYLRELVKAGELASLGKTGARQFVPAWAPAALKAAHQSRQRIRSQREQIAQGRYQLEEQP